MEVANEEMSEYELISVGGISEFIFLTFNLRKVNVRRGKSTVFMYGTKFKAQKKWRVWWVGEEMRR